MMRERMVALVALGLSACAFIDDFDRFRTGARDAGEQGDLDAEPSEELDAESPEGDAEPGSDEGGGMFDAQARDARVEAGEPLDARGDGDGAAPPPGDLACRGKQDGISCGDGQLICRKGFCRTSRCGDGFVDSARNEQCDDANLVMGDGCEPSSCRFSCENNARCDNGYPCDGQELCEISSHKCSADNSPATGVSCLRDMRAGVCDDKGFCRTAGCGDGTVAAGEQCDPAQPSPPAGCRADCTLGCTDNAACSDGDMCNGAESCDLASATCKPGTKLSCSDGDPCTEDGLCDAIAGCRYPLIDADGDQVSEQICSPGSRFRGGDCDGKNPAVYPGAIEYCDGLDNDCDGMRDENAVMATCYPDADGDGFPAMQGAQMRCSCGAGTRLARADGYWDCNDDARRSGGDVYPTQDAFFGVGYEVPCSNGSGTCVSFDYNCDTAETGQYAVGSGCGLLNCAGSGYSAAAPACGREGTYQLCESGSILGCTGRNEQRRQLCR